MFKFHNPFSFSPLTKDERHKKSQEEKLQKEVAKVTENVVHSANDCLTSDLFAKYRQAYFEAERDLIEIGTKLSIVDPTSYAVAAHQIFDRLNLIKLLMDNVTRDVERKSNAPKTET